MVPAGPSEQCGEEGGGPLPPELAGDGLHPVVGEDEETLARLPPHLHQEAVVLVPLVAPGHPDVATQRHLENKSLLTNDCHL